MSGVVFQGALKTISLYVAIYALCHFFGCRNILKWRALRPGVFSVVILLLGQYAAETEILSPAGVPALVSILLWSLPYGWVRGHTEGEENKDFSRMKGEFFVGSSGAVMGLLLQGNVVSTAADLIGLVFLFFSAASAVSYVVYYTLFHAMFDTGDMVPVLLTDRKEAFSFIRSEIGVEKSIFIVAALVVVAMLGWILLQGIALEKDVGSERYFTWGIFVLAAGLFFQYIWQAYPVKQLWDARAYIVMMKKNSTRHAQNLKNLTVKMKNGMPGTTILVIGESANRDHMRCFNSSYPVETTPWESSVKVISGFYFFPNAYACFSQTAEVLPYLLSGMNQYNHTSSDYLLSLVDIAKAAGMETWWLTNQGQGDTVTMTLADCADHTVWTPAPEGDDVQLLDLLKKIPGTGSHFIVVHIMGSHIRYADRVPVDFDKIWQSGAGKKTNAYDTAIAYTDHLLQRIYEIGTEYLHADTILYVSDHGEDMKYTHGTGHFTWNMVRIPLWLYVSETYRQRHPDIIDALKKHENMVFTNDLIFDTLSGLMDVQSNYYTREFDLSSATYHMTKEQALTMYGVKSISEEEKKL